MLYINIDGSKERGFGVVIYHDWDEAAPFNAGTTSKAIATGYTTSSRQARIHPIMFLSRLLTDAKRNYWPTELEVTGLVWAVRKVWHLIESSVSKIVVYTDHSATVDIAKASLTTTSTIHLNLRLVRASQYLQQFDLDVRHKPGKLNVILDALSCLASSNKSSLPKHHSELDALHANAYAYTTILVEMNEDFKERIANGYQSDPSWIKILAVLNKEESYSNADVLGDIEETSDRAITQAPFCRLIYHIDKTTGVKRLCIPNAMVKDILEIAYSASGHLDLHGAMSGPQVHGTYVA